MAPLVLHIDAALSPTASGDSVVPASLVSDSAGSGKQVRGLLVCFKVRARPPGRPAGRGADSREGGTQLPPGRYGADRSWLPTPAHCHTYCVLQDVAYSIPATSGAAGAKTMLLEGITGFFEPGQMTAVVSSQQLGSPAVPA